MYIVCGKPGYEANMYIYRYKYRMAAVASWQKTDRSVTGVVSQHVLRPGVGRDIAWVCGTLEGESIRSEACLVTVVSLSLVSGHVDTMMDTVSEDELMEGRK